MYIKSYEQIQLFFLCLTECMQIKNTKVSLFPPMDYNLSPLFPFKLKIGKKNLNEMILVEKMGESVDINKNKKHNTNYVLNNTSRIL